MFVPPVGLDTDELVRVLRLDWGIEVAELAYEPVGFGTHHYQAEATDGTRWFVNVDVLADKTWLGRTEAQAFDALTRSLTTAAALGEAGLEFVHGPRRRTGGGFVVRSGAWAVSVFPFLHGSGQPYGEFPDVGLRRRVLAALGRVHTATAAVPRELPRRDTLAVPNRDEFTEALAGTWSDGPYARRARELVLGARTRIDELFGQYDALVPTVLATSDEWVVTHGEPHAGNVMTTADGIALIDWDTVALAPRERDLWMIEPRDAADWSAYGLVTEADPAALVLYRLWWDLSEICGYTVEFRDPHVEDDNTRVAWRSLSGYLA